MSKPGPKRGRYWARLWHRWLGVVFLFPLLWLTVSGLALRYSEELGLDQSMVRSNWILEKYGMFPEGEVQIVKLPKREVCEWGEVLFLEGRMLEEVGTLRGAVGYGGGVIVATEDHLLVYDASGEWEQKLGEESLPGVPVEAIGTAVDGMVVVRVAGNVWKFDEVLIGSAEVADEGMTWSVTEACDEEELRKLERATADQAGIPWSRVMLDLHSGNLGGTMGKLILDLSGLGIIVLSLMGLKLVFRKPRGGHA